MNCLDLNTGKLLWTVPLGEFPELTARGFTDVVNLAGGIDAWSCEVDAGVPRY